MSAKRPAAHDADHGARSTAPLGPLFVAVSGRRGREQLLVRGIRSFSRELRSARRAWHAALFVCVRTRLRVLACVCVRAHVLVHACVSTALTRQFLFSHLSADGASLRKSAKLTPPDQRLLSQTQALSNRAYIKRVRCAFSFLCAY